MKALMAFVATFVLAGCAHQARTHSGTAVKVGDGARLFNEKYGRVPVARSERAFGQFVTAMVDHDQNAVAEMARAGDLSVAEAGSSVTILGLSPGDGAHVRFLDGSHKGQEGWVPLLSLE